MASTPPTVGLDQATSDLIRSLFQGSDLSVSRQKVEDTRAAIEQRLAARPASRIPFPPCADVLLATINAKAEPADEIAALFSEYFTFKSGELIGEADKALLDQDLFGALDKKWPPQCCLPSPTVSLEGTRFAYVPPARGSRLRGLMAGDLVWLFYMERMGLFRMLGALLDDYATVGKYPIPNDTIEAKVAETMVRLVKSGLSSDVRGRDASYRRCLNWTSQSGRKLGSSATANSDFDTHFHRIIQLALEYYKDLRLAETIRGDLSAGRTSVATLTSIKNTAILLQQSLDPFGYGRNAANTLSGIVWVVATLGIVRKLVQNLGIPVNFTDPDKFIPAVYELLVERRPATAAESHRYTAHLDAARYGRRILLDLEVLKPADLSELQPWLVLAEDSIEGYRTAYRTLTGIDLGAGGAPAIEQRA